MHRAVSVVYYLLQLPCGCYCCSDGVTHCQRKCPAADKDEIDHASGDQLQFLVGKVRVAVENHLLEIDHLNYFGLPSSPNREFDSIRVPREKKRYRAT